MPSRRRCTAPSGVAPRSNAAGILARRTSLDRRLGADPGDLIPTGLLSRASAALLVAASLVASLPLGGCRCANTEGPRFEPRGAAPTPAPPAARAFEPTLFDHFEPLPARPITRLTIGLDSTDVDNAALIGTWPPPALARARSEAPPGEPRWPNVERHLPGLEPAETEDPRLRAALERARRAEIAATGAGHGSTHLALAVDRRVPFFVLERAIRTANAAGYLIPEFVVGPPEDERVIPWPVGARVQRYSEDDLRGLLAGEPLPDRPSDVPLRVEVRPESIQVHYLGHLRGPDCESEAASDQLFTFVEAPPVAALARCFQRLKRNGAEGLTLALAGELPHERVLPLLALAGEFARVGVVRLR